MAARLLANENVPGAAIAALRQQGHDVAWVREDAPGSPDPEVLDRAQRENRVVVTFDKDFGELAVRVGLAASVGVVLFRITLSSRIMPLEPLLLRLPVAQTGPATLPWLKTTEFGSEHCRIGHLAVT